VTKTIPQKSISTQRAFSMIELVIVMAIISILAAISVPFMWNYLDKAQSVSAVSDIERISRSIELYVAQTGHPPSSLSDVYMDKLKDPWGNPYQYLSFETVKGNGKGKFRKDRNLVPINSDYDLYSMGPDGKSSGPLTAAASRDDIIRAGNGSFVGIAEDY
jgi:general secretion pathway protein G